MVRQLCTALPSAAIEINLLLPLPPRAAECCAKTNRTKSNRRAAASLPDCEDMTMVARGIDGIYRTEAHESHNGGMLPVADETGPHIGVLADLTTDDTNTLNKWFAASFAALIENEGWPSVLARALEPLEQKIAELELKIATLTGAIDTLRSGTPGSLRIRGTYSATENYFLHDVVAYNGASWVATRDRPGPLPGDHWQLLASAGKRGERGFQGPRGLESDWRHISFDANKMALQIWRNDGSPGPTFFLRTLFSGIDIDKSTYELVLRTSEGGEIRFSLRPLFEQFDAEKSGAAAAIHEDDHNQPERGRNLADAPTVVYEAGSGG
jgi:hypothetical protein